MSSLLPDVCYYFVNVEMSENVVEFNSIASFVEPSANTRSATDALYHSWTQGYPVSRAENARATQTTVHAHKYHTARA